MIQLDIKDLQPESNELKVRLLGDASFETRKKCDIALCEILSVAECSYCFKEVKAAYIDGSADLGFGEIKSHDLVKFLSSADRVYLVAVSLGIAVDRLLRKKAVVSTAEHFVFDAVASALVEAVCDKVQALLPDSAIPRFSPGYGDLDLRIQTPLLKFLNADTIRLTESGLMIPSKSVTFIARKL